MLRGGAGGRGQSPRGRGAAALLLFGTLSPAAPAAAEEAAEESATACRDGLHNDLDGAADCADPGCLPWAFCASGAVAPPPRVPVEPVPPVPTEVPPIVVPPPPPVVAEETSVEACSDGVDNDGDGALDCLDPGCTWLFCQRARGEVPAAPTVQPPPPPAPPPAPPRPRSVWDQAGPAPAPPSEAAPQQGRGRAGLGLAEDPGSWHYELGAFFRYVFFPGFLVDALAARPAGVEAPAFANPAAGVSFGARRGGFEVVTSLWWAGYMHDEFLSGEHTDSDWPAYHDWSDLSALVLGVDLVWSSSLAEWVSITYGFGAGIMFGLGHPTVTSAVPLALFPDVQYEGETDGASRFARCDEVWGPSCAGVLWEAPEPYVDAPDTSPWPVAPWFDVLLGVRFRPHRHVAIDVDGGFGVGLFVGARASYVI